MAVIERDGSAVPVKDLPLHTTRTPSSELVEEHRRDPVASECGKHEEIL